MYDNGLPINDDYNEDEILRELIENCEHEFVAREYSTQPFGTCLNCGITVLGHPNK